MTWARLQRAGEKKVAARLAETRLEIPYSPGWDNCLVLREPPPPVVKQTEGGIFIPENAQEDPEPKSEGVLVAGGLQALDAFRSHGFVVGDRVQIGRFAGWEKEFELDSKGKNTKKILQMKAGDVLGSFDLEERLHGATPSMEIAWDDDLGQHLIRPIGDK